MRGPLEAPEIRQEELPAPDRSVGPVPGSVEGDADDRAGYPVLGQTARHVGMVVLDSNLLQIR